MADNAMDKIIQMMDKFETACRETDISERSNSGNYTNFSVSEILKPDFGQNCKPFCYCYHQKLTDIVSSTDELSDVSSDSDEITSSEYETRDSESPDSQISHSTTRVRKNGFIADEPLFQHSYADVIPFSLLDRFRRQNLEEDGYSSSDSESALDLRIERKKTPPKTLIPAWVFCTRYSDRPSAGPRAKRRKRSTTTISKRNRVAFNDHQIHQLSLEFERSPYLFEKRRQQLAEKLNLSESNVKIWFQNKRAKLKKEAHPNPLALKLMEQGLYNHRTVQLRNETDNSDSDVSYGSTC